MSRNLRHYMRCVKRFLTKVGEKGEGHITAFPFFKRYFSRYLTSNTVPLLEIGPQNFGLQSLNNNENCNNDHIPGFNHELVVSYTNTHTHTHTKPCNVFFLFWTKTGNDAPKTFFKIIPLFLTYILSILIRWSTNSNIEATEDFNLMLVHTHRELC